MAKATIKHMMKQHADAAKELGAWYKIAKKARWETLADVRDQFLDADQVHKVLIFNIRQNSYRLIVKADLKMKILMVKALLTHKEYERGEWKNGRNRSQAIRQGSREVSARGNRDESAVRKGSCGS